MPVRQAGASERKRDEEEMETIRGEETIETYRMAPHRMPLNNNNNNC